MVMSVGGSGPCFAWHCGNASLKVVLLAPALIAIPCNCWQTLEPIKRSWWSWNFRTGEVWRLEIRKQSVETMGIGVFRQYADAGIVAQRFA